MPMITFVRPDGSKIALKGAPGQTVMQPATANGVSEILADCGGACACATCHVIVDEAWAQKLPPKQAMEADMVEFAAAPQPTSRLSCQLTITDSLDGLTLRLPSYQA